MSGIANQIVQHLILPIQKQPTNQQATSKVFADAYRPVTKFGEGGHGINPAYQKISPIVPTGNVPA